MFRHRPRSNSGRPLSRHCQVATFALAPYDRVRKEVRSTIAPLGGFVLVYLATPLDICEQRDRKGLYGKARAGILPQFTGLTDPYEPPTDAEIIIDTAVVKPLDATQQILDYLRRKRYLRDSEDLSCRNL